MNTQKNDIGTLGNSMIATGAGTAFLSGSLFGVPGAVVGAVVGALIGLYAGRPKIQKEPSAPQSGFISVTTRSGTVSVAHSKKRTDDGLHHQFSYSGADKRAGIGVS